MPLAKPPGSARPCPACAGARSAGSIGGRTAASDRSRARSATERRTAEVVKPRSGRAVPPERDAAGRRPAACRVPVRDRPRGPPGGTAARAGGPHSETLA